MFIYFIGQDKAVKFIGQFRNVFEFFPGKNLAAGIGGKIDTAALRHTDLDHAKAYRGELDLFPLQDRVTDDRQ